MEEEKRASPYFGAVSRSNHQTQHYHSNSAYPMNRGRQGTATSNGGGSRFPATERSRQMNLSQVSTVSSATGFDEMSRVSRYSSVSTASAASSASTASSSYPGSDRWAPQHASNSCNLCNEKFSLLRRSHRCRRCGYLFCAKCSRFKAALTGHTHKSRLCETCFPKVLSGSKPPMNAFVHSKAWVPRGVFTHMLSYLNHVDLCLA
ncbi:hypothetical protein BBJ28_00004130, partial [Nothophytophthora sp. Chile5]